MCCNNTNCNRYNNSAWSANTAVFDSDSGFTGYPVYYTMPFFYWNDSSANNGNSCGNNCGCNRCGCRNGCGSCGC